MSLTDAVWDIEAALNYEVGDLTKEFNDLTVQSISVPLEISNGQADADAVYAAYNSALLLVAPLTTG